MLKCPPQKTLKAVNTATVTRAGRLLHKLISNTTPARRVEEQAANTAVLR
jgi:hypothetical protein